MHDCLKKVIYKHEKHANIPDVFATINSLLSSVSPLPQLMRVPLSLVETIWKVAEEVIVFSDTSMSKYLMLLIVIKEPALLVAVYVTVKPLLLHLRVPVAVMQIKTKVCPGAVGKLLEGVVCSKVTLCTA